MKSPEGFVIFQVLEESIQNCVRQAIEECRGLEEPQTLKKNDEGLVLYGLRAS